MGENKKADIQLDNEVIALSGRTALDFIIRDIKASKEFNSVMLPSYCCASMIEPFVRNGISVGFYKVSEVGIEYPQNDRDAVLLLDFFGYIDERITQIADDAKQNGKIVIYDSTHYLGQRNINSDYQFCSYRKWFFCNFTSVKKMEGVWLVPTLKNHHVRYVSLRNKAAELKEKYINSEFTEKQVFRDMFSEAEELLETDYLNYCGEKLFLIRLT